MFTIYLYFCSYYLELLHQEYGGAAGINLALFQESSSFTADQTDDAVNEVQLITAAYDVFNEEQVRCAVMLTRSFIMLNT